MHESAHVIDCGGDAMVAILHHPDSAPTRAVLMVTAGGPQYRVGGHRQLTLWARALCSRGLAVLRFDQRGKGDAGGEYRDFVDMDDDIRCALDQLTAECPSLREIVLWGECNAASAILYYAHTDPRVTGAVLLNPWVRTEAGAAKATLKYYYLQRLTQPSFWRKLFSGRFNPFASLRSALQLLRAARNAVAPDQRTNTIPAINSISRELPLTEGLLLGLQRFKGRLLVILSGRDLVAQEYEMAVSESTAWQQALAACHTQTERFADSDHTFSSAEQRQAVLARAQSWLDELPSIKQASAHGTP